MPETKGITIEFYGKDIALQDTLTDINKGLKATRTELGDFKKQLKIDPSNLDALKGKFEKLKQEQMLLTEQAELYRKELSKMGKEEIGSDQWNAYKKKLDQAEKSLQKVTSEIHKMSDENGMLKVSDHAEKMGNSFKKAEENVISFRDVVNAEIIGQAVIDGIKSLASAMKQTVNELHGWAESFREAQVYEAQFESNIRNTADATDDQIASLKKLAKQRQRNGVISAKAITSAYQELATYVESTDAIEGLTNALTDMAAQQYGVDATEESVRNLATTLGKALANGDYSGLTRLGYGFDETQKYIMKYGDELERVAVLNDVIESSIGGMNEALAQTDAGQIFQMKEWFDDTKESVGEIISQLELEFAQRVVPELQKFTDEVLAWIITHKDDFIDMVQQIAEWLTSDEVKQFFSDVAQVLSDFADIFDYVVKIGKDIGLWEGIFNIVKGVVAGIKQLFDAIAADVAAISNFGIGSWMKGNYNSYYPGTFDSGGYGSGGYASGGITLNASFNVNSSNITRSDIKAWASWLADDINQQLGARLG